VRGERSVRHSYHGGCTALLVLVAAVVGVASPARARDPETLCATQDANRLHISRPSLGFFDPKKDVYSKTPGGVRVATCELRVNGRTIFQRYDAGKVVVHGFFLQGKRSGRWLEEGRPVIYAGGQVMQPTPASECDPVAQIGLAITVYCPRTTPFKGMVADFDVWDRFLGQRAARAKGLRGLVFDVYSDEAKTPDTKEAFNAFPEKSPINFAKAQFMGSKLDTFLCLRPDGARRSCLDLVGESKP